MVEFPRRTVLSHAVAAALLAEVERRACEAAVGLCAVVCDDAGLLAGLVRTDGARPHNIKMARVKAESAASFGMDTHQWREFCAGDQTTLAGLLGGFGSVALFGGGVAIVADGVIVGGLGVSGPDEKQDIEFAAGALAAVLG